MTAQVKKGNRQNAAYRPVRRLHGGETRPRARSTGAASGGPRCGQRGAAQGGDAGEGRHPFLYVKRHFGYATVRYRGLGISQAARWRQPGPPGTINLTPFDPARLRLVDARLPPRVAADRCAPTLPAAWATGQRSCPLGGIPGSCPDPPARASRRGLAGRGDSRTALSASLPPGPDRESINARGRRRLSATPWPAMADPRSTAGRWPISHHSRRRLMGAGLPVGGQRQDMGRQATA